MDLRILVGMAAAAVAFWAAPPSASADRSEAVKLLVTMGDIPPPRAKQVVQRISARMAKSAGAFANDRDPFRIAVSRALFGADVPQGSTQKAKVRLRLFSGLTRWSIGALFGPQARDVVACDELGLHPRQCAVLADVGERLAPEVPEGRMASRAADRSGDIDQVREAPEAPELGRFGKYDSGFRANGAAQNKATAGSRAQLSARSGMAASPAQSTSRPAAPPAAAARAAPDPANQSATRAAYLARRQAYLDRQKARAEEAKKARTEELANSRVQRGPAAGSVEAQVLVEVDDQGNAVGGGGAGAKPSPADDKAKGKQPAAAAPAAAAADEGGGDDLGGLVDDLLAN